MRERRRGQFKCLCIQNPLFTTTRTYDASNRVASVTEEIDASTTRTTSFVYDAMGHRTRVTKPEGNEEAWTYDERGRVATHVQGYGDAKAATTSYFYDANGNLVRVRNPRGHDTDFVYDLFDRRIRTTDVIGRYTAETLDMNGHVTRIARYDASDTLLQQSDRAFDRRGRHYRTTDMRYDQSGSLADAVTTLERRRTNQVAKVTDARGNATTSTFDAFHRVSTVTDALGNIRTNTYDLNGNVTAWSIQETDGTSTVTHQYEATYDELNRRLTQVEIDRLNAQNTLTTTFAYDSRSQRVWAVNAMGDPTRWTFDGLGRMTQRERALTVGAQIESFLTAQVTQWTFDANDRLTAHTDDGQNASSWTYDALDRPTAMTFPDTKSYAYVYDANGNVTKVTDPAGNVIEDTFDALDRNTARAVTLVSGFGGTTAETRTYDALGRLVSTADDDTLVEFEYSVIGLRSLVAQETESFVGPSPQPMIVATTHDPVGNKTGEVYPSGFTVGYSWNAGNRLTQVTDGLNAIATMTYWGSRPKQTTFGNGTTDTRTYTGFRGEVATVHHQAQPSGTTLLQLDYGYDLNHDRLYERFGGAGSSGDGFAYDKLRRLTNAWMGSAVPSAPAANAYVKKIDYAYDDDGNRTSVVTTPWGGAPGSTSYTTNQNYQYTAVGGTSHVWDANGNLRDDGTFTYAYDYRGQLIEVKQKPTGMPVAWYRYDALGRRVEKQLMAGSTERYVLSGLETIQVYDGNGAWKQDFVYGEGIDQILMLQQQDILDHDNDQDTSELARHYYHRNALGSVMEITDPLQAVAVSYRYDPYGKATITRGGQVLAGDPLGQHVAFTARWLDEETGLYYYRARMYSPALGRFCQRDPLGFSPDPNLFSYVNNSPGNLKDPLGTCPNPARMDGDPAGPAPKQPRGLTQWRSQTAAAYKKCVRLDPRSCLRCCDEVRGSYQDVSDDYYASIAAGAVRTDLAHPAIRSALEASAPGLVPALLASSGAGVKEFAKSLATTVGATAEIATREAVKAVGGEMLSQSVLSLTALVHLTSTWRQKVLSQARSKAEVDNLIAAGHRSCQRACRELAVLPSQVQPPFPYPRGPFTQAPANSIGVLATTGDSWPTEGLGTKIHTLVSRGGLRRCADLMHGTR